MNIVGNIVCVEPGAAGGNLGCLKLANVKPRKIPLVPVGILGNLGCGTLVKT